MDGKGGQEQARLVRHLGKLGHSNLRRRQGQAARLVKAPLHKRVEYG